MNNTQNLSEMLSNIQANEINPEFIIRMYREKQKADNDLFFGIIKYFDEKSVQTPETIMEDIPLNVDDVTQINGTEEEAESEKPKLNINEILATGDWKLIMSRKEENKESVNRYNMLENKNKTYKTPKTVVVQLYTKNKPTQTIIKFHSIGGCIYALLGLKGDPKDTILQKLGNKSFDGTFKIENQPNSMWKIIEIGDLPFDEYQKICRANNNKKKKTDDIDNNDSNVNENSESKPKQVKKDKWLFTYKETNKPETQRTFKTLGAFVNEFYPDLTDKEKTKIVNRLNNTHSYENWTAVRLDK